MAEALWTRQQVDGHLSSRIGYKVVKVNQGARSRIEKIVVGYHGPDAATLSLLDLEGQIWLEQPALFFKKDCDNERRHFEDPQLALLHLFLGTERDTA